MSIKWGHSAVCLVQCYVTLRTWGMKHGLVRPRVCVCCEGADFLSHHHQSILCARRVNFFLPSVPDRTVVGYLRVRRWKCIFVQQQRAPDNGKEDTVTVGVYNIIANLVNASKPKSGPFSCCSRDITGDTLNWYQNTNATIRRPSRVKKWNSDGSW